MEKSVCQLSFLRLICLQRWTGVFRSNKSLSSFIAFKLLEGSIDLSLNRVVIYAQLIEMITDWLKF